MRLTRVLTIGVLTALMLTMSPANAVKPTPPPPYTITVGGALTGDVTGLDAVGTGTVTFTASMYLDSTTSTMLYVDLPSTTAITSATLGEGSNCTIVGSVTYSTSHVLVAIDHCDVNDTIDLVLETTGNADAAIAGVLRLNSAVNRSGKGGNLKSYSLGVNSTSAYHVVPSI